MFRCHGRIELLGGVCDHVIERRGFEIRRLFKSFEFFYKKKKKKVERTLKKGSRYNKCPSFPQLKRIYALER